MCGIVGYVGDSACEKILVDALKKLEYRGYDSAGIAVFEDDRIKTVKAKGKIDYKNIICSPGNPLGMFQFEATILVDIEYRILGIFRDVKEPVVIAYDPEWNYQDALEQIGKLKKIYEESSLQELIECKIQSREVTKWSDVESSEVESMSRDEMINKLSEDLELDKEVVSSDFDFLDDLRLSGVTNMFGALPYLKDYDGSLTDKQAKSILKGWMNSFNK